MGLCLHAKFHLTPFTVAPMDEKLQFWATFQIWGPAPSPSIDKGQMWHAKVCP